MVLINLAKIRNALSRFDLYAIRQYFSQVQIRPRRSIFYLVLIILGLYLVLGGVGTALVYGKVSQSPVSQFMARFYPYPAAWVGGHIITLAELNHQYGFVKHYSVQTGQAAPKRSEVLESLIETELIKKEDAKYHITVTDNEVGATFDKIAQEEGGKNKVLQVLAALYQMNENDFRALIRNRLYQEKFKSEVLVNIRARHILMSDENKAKEILDRVKKGEDFAALAKQFSQDANTKDKGGEIDWFPRGSLPGEFEEVAFKLKAGDIASDVVKTPFGLDIIQVAVRRGFIDLNFEQWKALAKKNTRIIRLIKN